MRVQIQKTCKGFDILDEGWQIIAYVDLNLHQKLKKFNLIWYFSAFEVKKIMFSFISLL